MRRPIMSSIPQGLILRLFNTFVSVMDSGVEHMLSKIAGIKLCGAVNMLEGMPARRSEEWTHKKLKSWRTIVRSCTWAGTVPSKIQTEQRMDKEHPWREGFGQYRWWETQHWPREGVGAPFLETFKARMVFEQSGLVKNIPAHSHEGWN